MNLASAIELVRYFARSANSSTLYPDGRITTIIQTVCDEFVRRTKLTKTLSTINLTAAAAGVLPTMPTGFRPDRLLSAYLTGTNVVVGFNAIMPSPVYGPSIYYTEGARDWYGPSRSATLRVIPYQQLIEMKYSGLQTGQPQFIAFSSGVVDTAVGECFPAPDQTYVANILWWKAFDTADTTLIIPDDIMRTILIDGVAAKIQQSEPDNEWAVPALKRYNEWVDAIATAGGLGATEVISVGRGR